MNTLRHRPARERLLLHRLLLHCLQLLHVLLLTLLHWLLLLHVLLHGLLHACIGMTACVTGAFSQVAGGAARRHHGCCRQCKG
jgi:hypothetical protein